LKGEPIIVVTGTPGVGKTTVSNHLATGLKAVHLDLAEIAKRGRFYMAKDPQRETFIVDIEGLTKNIERRLKNTSSRIIVSGHYAMNVISPRHNVKVFVLRCDPYELKERLERRGFDPKKVAENVQAEILDTCFSDAVGIYGEEKVYQIDVTKKSILEVCAEIQDLLENRIAPEKKVDWLGKLDASGVLDDFFPMKR
jgi:adenylate kinase